MSRPVQIDALRRRSRFAKPQPTAKAIILNEADLAIFEALHRHGCLPSTYLQEFTGHLRRKGHRDRLTLLYNGTRDGERYLDKPAQQFDSYFAQCAPLVYSLLPPAEQALAERGRLAPRPERTDPFVHRLMTACAGASIELAAAAKECRYIPMAEVLAHRKSTLSVPLVRSSRVTLVPDDLFGIRYPNGYRFFAVEIDRNTQSVSRTDLAQSAYGRKLESYVQLLRTKAFERHWGIPKLLVLTLTTNAPHIRTMTEYLGRLNASDCAGKFLFNAVPSFGNHWRVPKLPMPELFTGAWQHADGSAFCIEQV